MPSESEHKLIESIYDVTIDLAKYSDLLSLWEAEFLRPVAGTSEMAQNIDPSIEAHVTRASTVLDMTQAQNEAMPSLRQLVVENTLPIFMLSVDKKISLVNDAALDFFGFEAGKKLPEQAFELEDGLKIDQYLNQLDELEAGRILAIIQPQDDEGEASLLFALFKVHDAETAQDYLQISAVHTVWNDDVADIIKNTFALSDAEIDLAQRYVAGEKLADIAEERGRSLNTVKTQSKILLRKTKLKTQSELVRLFSALQNFGVQNDDVKTNDAGIGKERHTNIIEREDGRKIYYEIYGDPKGEPVLFAHDIIMGTKLPQKLIGYLYAQKIKLIAPHRAGYGYSDVYMGPDRLNNFVEDVSLVLEAEKVDRFKILGFYAGSVYAFYLAIAMPQRLIKMRLINSYVPVTSQAQMDAIPMPIKVLVYTAKYMPKLFPFFMHVMAAQVKRLGHDYVMKEYFKDSEFDLKSCQDPDIAEFIAESFNCAFETGTLGTSQTAIDAIGYDWPSLLKENKMIVEYFHASESFSPVDLVKDIAQMQESFSLKLFKGGQLILYENPEEMLKGL